MTRPDDIAQWAWEEAETYVPICTTFEDIRMVQGAIARALQAAEQRRVSQERQRCELICREEWQAIVAKHKLRPGTPTEEFAGAVLNRIRETIS